MKKINIIVSIVLLTVILTSCSTPHSTITSSEMSTNNSPPPQPIEFGNIDLAISFINEGNLDKYSKEETRVAYQNMITTFKNEGYLTTVTHSIATKYDDKVVLYPEAKQEDIGIHYWFVLDDIFYQVIVYNIKAGDSYTIDPKTQNFLDYNSIRFRINLADSETIAVNNPTINTLIVTQIEENSYRGYFILDEKHYVCVRANSNELSKSDFLNFVEDLSFGKEFIK